jgi:hypothetical protein
MHCGWGITLLDAIKDYDEKNSNWTRILIGKDDGKYV